MEMPFDKLNTIRLILKTYHQFSEPLFCLYKLSAGSDLPEAEKVKEIYQKYLDSIGATDREREPDIKIQENLETELENADDKELFDMLLECKNLAKVYNLPVYSEIHKNYPDNVQLVYGFGISNGNDWNKASFEKSIVEKLMVQVDKFGDEQINKCLAEIEIGNSLIVFEEMEENAEGYTKFENGQIKYCLSKKFEKISSDEELWKASIILAHELQRNPATGDLRGDTTEIVMRDVGFIEQLAEKYGETVYKKIPEFAILHDVKKIFGEDGIKEFSEIMFNHEMNYWKISKESELLKIELMYRMIIFVGRIKGLHMAAENLLHFLKGSGARRYLDASYLKSFKSVQETVLINYERYKAAFVKKTQEMSKDKIFYFKNYPEEGHRAYEPFDKPHYYEGKEADQYSEPDLFYGSGTFNIATFCDIAIAKDDDGKFYATGKMLNIFWDKYDWHKGLDVKIKILGEIALIIPDEYAIALVEAGRAAEFEMQSSWTEYGIDWELETDVLY